MTASNATAANAMTENLGRNVAAAAGRSELARVMAKLVNARPPTHVAAAAAWPASAR